LTLLIFLLECREITITSITRVTNGAPMDEITPFTSQGKPVMIHFDNSSRNTLNPVLEELLEAYKDKVIVIRIDLVTSIFKEFEIRNAPAFVACWGDKKIKKIENDDIDLSDDHLQWWEKNKGSVEDMMVKLGSKNNEIIIFRTC